MSRKFLVSIDHNKLESLNFRYQNLATAPSSPVVGQSYFNTVDNVTYIYDGTAWQPADPAKAKNASIPFAALIGAAPINNPTFTNLVTIPPNEAGSAKGIKLTAGTLLSSPTSGESGLLEYNGTSLSFIDSTGARKTLGVSGAGIQSVTLTEPAAGFTITSGGTGSDPTYTFALSDDLAAIEALSGSGFVKRTGSNTWSVGDDIDLTADVTGTLPVANGGTGQTSYTNGQLLIGNTTGNTLTKATLTQGTGIAITNGSGSITISNAGVTSVNGGTGAITNVALTTGHLGQFAATTSAQLAGVISDETGSGSLVFATSPTLSGTPLSTTAAADTNTTQIATTAFVIGQAGSATPAALGSAAAGSSPRYSRQDHVHAMPTLSQVGAPSADVAWGGYKITNLADPTSAQDAATKNYVDNAISGLAWKDEVRVATTANIANLSGGAPSTIDGVSLSANDRILVKNQSSAAQNGIYIVQTVGSGSNGTWVRSSDADTAAKIRGAAVFVSDGSTNGGYRYVLNTTGTITLGTTPLTFVVFDAVVSYTNGNGLDLAGNVFSVKVVSGGGIDVGASGIEVDTAVVVRKYSETIGDNASTSIAVTHNLGSQDVTVSIREVSTNTVVEADWTATSGNVVTFGFAVAPATNSLRVTIHA